MGIIVASLLRNEANKFLPSALSAWGRFADKIVVLDDSSDDNTAEMCMRAGCKVYLRYDRVKDVEPALAWGKEWTARQELWDAALRHADEGDYIFVLDGDMVPAKDPRPFTRTGADAVAFNLYDLWDEDSYRSDFMWCGHDNWRVWMMRAPVSTAPKDTWNQTGIHCGHFPSNLLDNHSKIVFAPRDYGLLHYAYSSPSLRKRKHEQYLDVRRQLSSNELLHAQSIVDDEPNLLRLPFSPAYRLHPVEGGDRGGVGNGAEVHQESDSNPTGDR